MSQHVGAGFGQQGLGQQGLGQHGFGQHGFGHGSQQGSRSQQQLVSMKAVAVRATIDEINPNSFITHSYWFGVVFKEIQLLTLFFGRAPLGIEPFGKLLAKKKGFTICRYALGNKCSSSFSSFRNFFSWNLCNVLIESRLKNHYLSRIFLGASNFCRFDRQLKRLMRYEISKSLSTTRSKKDFGKTLIFRV